jgi:hypothetical protein
MFALWTIVRFAVAVGAAVFLYLLGAALVRNFSAAEPPDDEPDESTLEDVDYRYRCIVCGAQLVLYSAQSGEVPDAPRHCREPMMLMAPIDDTGRPPSP